MAQNDNTLIFAPRPECLGCEFGRTVVNGDRITGELIFRFRMPDPNQCAVLTNFAWRTSGDKVGGE